MQSLKYKAVNWQDGMKISKDHLIQQESFFIECLRDVTSAQISAQNYGLLSLNNETGKSINLKVTVDPAKIIRAHLLECHAINAAGERIEISGSKLTADYDYSESKEKNFYVSISVNLFARVPVGSPAPNEEPARQPFCEPSYQLGIHPESQISNRENTLLIIGKLQTTDGRLQVIDDFIPPSTAVKNFHLLLEKYYLLGNQLGETANLNLSIVQKIHAKSQATSLVKSFMILSEKISDFLAGNLARFMGIISELPPVYLIENFIRFAYMIRFTLERMPPKDKEELLTYFSEWTDMTVPQINERISVMLRIEYRHDDILQSLSKAEEFMIMVHTIFSRLNALDFIGKKKGGGAFVTELPADQAKQEVKPQDQKKGWSFLAD
ncbi:MAG: hypothetical protein ABI763_15865 [Bacteroidota bacterium]